MKKILSILLALSMLFAMTACGETTANGEDGANDSAPCEPVNEASTDDENNGDISAATSTAEEEGDSCNANIAVGELTVDQVMNAPVAN